MDTQFAPLSVNAENLGCDRAGVPVVRGVDFRLKGGEAIQLFGANGAGKSTILLAVAGLMRTASGALRWTVDNQTREDRPAHEAVIYMGHEASVKSALTVRENLEFWTQIYGAARNKISAALEAFSLAPYADIRAGRLSAGQRRRLDLARCTLADRPLWLLDEPAASLDAEGAALVARIIRHHLKRGGAALIATHDPLDIDAVNIRLS